MNAAARPAAPPVSSSPACHFSSLSSSSSSSSSSKRIPLTPGRDREIIPRPTADSQSHRPGRTQVGSASACILVLFSPPGRCRSGNARTAPRLDQKLCGRHDQPVQSLSLLSLSFFVSRRARPIRLAPSRSLALSRAASLSLVPRSLARLHSSVSPSRPPRPSPLVRFAGMFDHTSWHPYLPQGTTPGLVPAAMWSPRPFRLSPPTRADTGMCVCMD